MQNPNSSSNPVKVLFVCLGNICRSPAAEGIFKKMVKDSSLQQDILVDSAGTSGWHIDNLPDERMRHHGQLRGYNFDSRARKFIAEDFKKFDYIIVMDDSNYKNASALAQSDQELKKLFKMTDFSTRSKFDYDHVPDPYYGDASGFELVMDLLEDACENLLVEIKVEHKLD